MIYLIGTGPMAQSYAQVLQNMGVPFAVIGRGITSAEKFEEVIGVKPFIGGLDRFLEHQNFNSDDYIIIATGTEALMPTLKKTLVSGAGKVLVEKPAAISINELLENEEFLREYLEKVFVAYNRRFFASVQEALKLIEDDGGLESMHFEFTEWAHKIEPLQKANGVKENWFFANSTHVVDLAFFIAGKPNEWQAFSKEGTLNWHSKTQFAGSGITEKNVLFSYHSNWESAGRWGIEFMTFKRKIILKPIEELKILYKGSVSIQNIDLNNELDTIYKPGLFKQLDVFLSEDTNLLVNIHEHLINTKSIYLKMI